MSQFIGVIIACPRALASVLSMSDVCAFRDYLVARGCPGSSRDLTKVLLWLQKEDVTCPEDLSHLRSLFGFAGVEKFQCNIIAFIDSLTGEGDGLGNPVDLVVVDTVVELEPPPKKICTARPVVFGIVLCIARLCLVFQARERTLVPCESLAYQSAVGCTIGHEAQAFS